MEQEVLDEKIETLYRQFEVPMKRIGKFRIELVVLEEEYANNPSKLNKSQLNKLSSLCKSLGRLRIEMGVLIPLLHYGAVQLADPSESFEKVLYGGCLTALTFAGGLLAYLSKEPFRQAKAVDNYLQAQQ